MNDSKINGGYVLQPRKLDRSDIMRMSPVVRELWSYLIRKVNWKDGKYPRGTGFFNFGDIQKDLCWYAGYRKIQYSKPQISKALRKLHEGNAVETMKATRGVIITILNYNYYQDKQNYEGNDEICTKDLRRKHSYNNKKRKEEKSIEYIYPKRAKKVFDFYIEKTKPALITKVGAIKNIQYYLKSEKHSVKEFIEAITNYSSVSGNHKKDPINFFGIDGDNEKYFESYLQENFIPPKKRKKKSSKKTRMTLDFPLTDKFKEYAIEKEIAEKDILGIFIDFRKHHEEKGKSREKWILSWYTWIQNKIKWGYSPNNKPKYKARTNDVPEEAKRGSDTYGQVETVLD